MDKEAYQAALSHPAHLINGSEIRVEEFLSGDSLQNKEQDMVRNKIVVFNIKPKMTKQDLFRLFEGYGVVQDIALKKKKNDNYAFVTFKRKDVAKKLVAMKKLVTTFRGEKFGFGEDGEAEDCQCAFFIKAYVSKQLAKQQIFSNLQKDPKTETKAKEGENESWGDQYSSNYPQKTPKTENKVQNFNSGQNSEKLVNKFRTPQTQNSSTLCTQLSSGRQERFKLGESEGLLTELAEKPQPLASRWGEEFKGLRSHKNLILSSKKGLKGARRPSFENYVNEDSGRFLSFGGSPVYPRASLKVPGGTRRKMTFDVEIIEERSPRSGIHPERLSSGFSGRSDDSMDEPCPLDSSENLEGSQNSENSQRSPKLKTGEKRFKPQLFHVDESEERISQAEQFRREAFQASDCQGYHGFRNLRLNRSKVPSKLSGVILTKRAYNSGKIMRRGKYLDKRSSQESDSGDFGPCWQKIGKQRFGSVYDLRRTRTWSSAF